MNRAKTVGSLGRGHMRRLMLVVAVGSAAPIGVPASHASPIQGCPAANPGKPTCTFTVKKSATGGQAGVVASTTWRLTNLGTGKTWTGKLGRYQFILPLGNYSLTALGKGTVAAGEV